LTDVICGPTDVVLEQAAPLEDSYLGETVSHLNAHEIATDRTSVTGAATTPLDDVGIDGFRRITSATRT
jgi:hypothetical protein